LQLRFSSVWSSKFPVSYNRRLDLGRSKEVNSSAIPSSVALKWERKAGIRNTPKLTGTGVYQDPSCDGIKYDLDFEDRFDAEHFGKVTKLVSWEVNDITTGCYV
jgi:hypothetical protein